MSAQEKMRQSAKDPLIQAALSSGHRIVMGPGEPALSEWAAAGLSLPNLEEMRNYRVNRIREQLVKNDIAGALLFDPLNLMYATDSPNMQLWVTHNQARWAFIAADGPIVLWEFNDCDFLSGHNSHVSEVRPNTSFTYFLAGDRSDEQAEKMAKEINALVKEHGGGNTRLAVDVIPPQGAAALEATGLTLTNGMQIMERARAIKGEDELLAMRCGIEATRISCQKLFEAITPGISEQQLWGVLWAEMLARGGEWMECRLLSAGPRTNPWFQECSSYVIQDGDLVGLDTDLVGSYGMMTDISRTWICGDLEPNAEQRHTHELALEQMMRNTELLTPGRTFHELTHKAWFPSIDDYRHYSCLFHGVGQCDEWPGIGFPASWDSHGYDGVLEPAMVMTVESYVGPYAGGEGVKLEDQILITETGYENLTPWSLSLTEFC